MISFSYRNFKEQLTQPLRQAESRFLIRTFIGACIYFFLFGFLVLLCDFLVARVLGRSTGVSVVLSFLGALVYLPLSFSSVVYRSNPLRGSGSRSAVNFLLLTFSFLFLFLGISNLLLLAVKGEQWHSTETTSFWPNIRTMARVLFFVFGSSIFIYAIPTVIAFHITKKKSILTLHKFLNWCSIAYLILFITSLLVAIIGFGIYRWVELIMMTLISILLFVSPVITIYRMRTIVPYINYEDKTERQKWENYFTFEISFQLLQIAFHVARLLIMMLSNSSRSRLL